MKEITDQSVGNITLELQWSACNCLGCIGKGLIAGDMAITWTVFWNLLYSLLDSKRMWRRGGPGEGEGGGGGSGLWKWHVKPVRARTTNQGDIGQGQIGRLHEWNPRDYMTGGEGDLIPTQNLFSTSISLYLYKHMFEQSFSWFIMFITFCRWCLVKLGWWCMW